MLILQLLCVVLVVVLCKKTMKELFEEYCCSYDPEELEKEKKKRSALHSIFPQLMGGMKDYTTYVLLDNNKNTGLQQSYVPNINNQNYKSDKDVFNNIIDEKSSLDSANMSKVLNVVKDNTNVKAFNIDNNLIMPDRQRKFTPFFRNPKNSFNFDDYCVNNNLLAVLGKSKPRTITNDSLNSNVKHDNGRRDSLWYDDGHLNVTFRNDVLGVNDFAPYKGSDRQGCKRRCVEMLNASGEELSGELIKMTINGEDGTPKNPSKNFQMGIDVINSTLDSGVPIILNVDHSIGNASSADGAGDHFIIVVGKSVIDGKTYYHFYDPATSDLKRGTANRNVLQIKDGYLTGDFLTGRGKVKRYKVTSVRLNKKKQFKK